MKHSELKDLLYINWMGKLYEDSSYDTYIAYKLKLKREETGYYLYDNIHTFQIFPIDSQKMNLLNAISQFVDNNLNDLTDKPVSGSMIKWYEFNPDDCTGTVEIILYG